jgi:uncharacterized membrane protein
LTENPLDRQAGAEDLYRLAEGKVLAPEGLEAALAHAGITPSRASWKAALDRVLLFLGSALILSGVIYFFAFNWDNLGRFAKFGLIEGAMLVALIIAWTKDLESLTGRISLLAAAVLLGPLLAVYGQVYQTGADAHGLFLAWVLLISGWVVMGRTSPLWLLCWALINVWLFLYWDQILRGRIEADETLFFLFMAFLNTLLLLLWEEAAKWGIEWLKPRWYPGIIGTAAVFFTTIFSVLSIFERRRVAWVYVPVLGILLVHSYARTRNLFTLSIAFLSLIVTVMSIIISFEPGEGDYLFLGLVVAGMTAAAAWLLRTIQKKWAGRPE